MNNLQTISETVFDYILNTMPMKKVKEFECERFYQKPIYGFEIFYDKKFEIQFCYTNKPSDYYLIAGGGRALYREAYLSIRQYVGDGNELHSYCFGDSSGFNLQQFQDRKFGAYKRLVDENHSQIQQLGDQEIETFSSEIKAIATRLKLTVDAENPIACNDRFFVPLLDEAYEDRYDDLLICLDHDRNFCSTV